MDQQDPFSKTISLLPVTYIILTISKVILGVITGLLPAVLMSILMSLVPVVMRCMFSYPYSPDTIVC